MSNFWVSLILGLANIGLAYRQDNDWFLFTGVVLLAMAYWDLHEELSDD